MIPILPIHEVERTKQILQYCWEFRANVFGIGVNINIYNTKHGIYHVKKYIGYGMAIFHQHQQSFSVQFTTQIGWKSSMQKVIYLILIQFNKECISLLSQKKISLLFQSHFSRDQICPAHLFIFIQLFPNQATDVRFLQSFPVYPETIT